ncbi:MAG: guanylate kinase [Ignavibacteria bacterium]|nr:MAG: guanylate kinase [Ignavibacteria bacterium]KAF0160990.1 MAG: guanylate kinase [Ignavibacteria bacterium]
MAKKEARLFVFSAPSGSGKTTIVKDVLKNYVHFVFSISATTRKKRQTEVDGKDYYFIKEKDFVEKIENNEFIEWEKFYDYYYGTLKSQIDSNIQNGLHTVFEVDVKGAIKIKEYNPRSILIFIAPPSIEELKSRLLQRNTETDEDLKKRIERAEMELGYQDKFDYVVTNVDLEIAKEKVRLIIENELKEN